MFVRRGATVVGWLLVAGGGLLAFGGGWALAAACLAGLIVMFATAGWSRVLVGVALVAVGLSSSLLLLVDSPGNGDARRAALVGGSLLVITAGSLITVFGRRWPSRRDRYQPDQSTADPSTRGPLDQWRALDRGEDPTLEPQQKTGTEPSKAPSTEPHPSDAAVRPPTQRVDE